MFCCSAVGGETKRNSDRSFIARRHAALFFSENAELDADELEPAFPLEEETEDGRTSHRFDPASPWP
jgi:hypothetical protein